MVEKKTPAKPVEVSDDVQDALSAALVLPTVNVRYDRKINMGNYESLGIGVSVTMPVGLSEEQQAALEPLYRDAIDQANKLAASEMNEKTAKIKARQRGEDSGA